MWKDVLMVAGAYLLGSIPHLMLLGKASGVQMDEDLHITLWQKGGRALGLTGIILDIAKGVTPVLTARLLGFDIVTVTAAGIAAAVGQMWPVFARFNGEKGNTIGVGVSAPLAIKPFLISIIAYAIGAGIKTLPRLWRQRQTVNQWTKFGGPPSNSLPLGMIAGFLILPLASWGFHEPLAVTIGLAILFILIVIRRITAGLGADLNNKGKLRSIIINRMLFDRSYR